MKPHFNKKNDVIWASFDDMKDEEFLEKVVNVPHQKKSKSIMV
jgi:hypothetical protein